jgi:hypothetical protein
MESLISRSLVSSPVAHIARELREERYRVYDAIARAEQNPAAGGATPSVDVGDRAGVTPGGTRRDRTSDRTPPDDHSCDLLIIGSPAPSPARDRHDEETLAAGSPLLTPGPEIDLASTAALHGSITGRVRAPTLLLPTDGTAGQSCISQATSY